MNWRKYAKRFVVGVAIGIGVWTGMSLFGLAGALAFVAPNPLTSTIYAGLFFGVIQASTAIMNDMFDPQREPGKTPPAAQQSQEPQISAPSQEISNTPAHAPSIVVQGPKVYADTLTAKAALDQSLIR